MTGSWSVAIKYFLKFVKSPFSTNHERNKREQKTECYVQGMVSSGYHFCTHQSFQSTQMNTAADLMLNALPQGAEVVDVERRQSFNSKNCPRLEMCPFQLKGTILSQKKIYPLLLERDPLSYTLTTTEKCSIGLQKKVKWLKYQKLFLEKTFDLQDGQPRPLIAELQTVQALPTVKEFICAQQVKHYNGGEDFGDLNLQDATIASKVIKFISA